MKIWRTTVALIALALPTKTGVAQEPPTVERVLLRFVPGEEFEVLQKAARDAGRLLRKEYGPLSATNTEALIDGLVDVILAADVGERRGPYWHAGGALTYAAWRPGSYVDGFGYRQAEDLDGEAVPAAFDALVRVYETLAARALADGGDDPFLEAALRDEASRTPTGFDTTHEEIQLYGALRGLFQAELAPDGRGWAYVLALFERSKPPCWDGPDELKPPDCTVGPGSAWCAAGNLLHQIALGDTRPWPGPDPDRWRRRCRSSRPWNSLSWRNG